MSSFDTKKTNRYLPVIGLVTLAAAVAIVLLGGAGGISQSNIDARLQDFSSYVAQAASQAGNEAAFTHGEVDVSGWGFNKSATIPAPSLVLTEKPGPSQFRWTLTTDHIRVVPEKASADGLAFLFENPIKIEGAGQAESQLHGSLTFSAPLKYAYIETGNDAKRSVVQALDLPPQMVFSLISAEHPTIPFTLTASYDAHPVIRSKASNEAREAQYDIRHLSLKTDQETQLDAAGVAGGYKQTSGADGHSAGKYTLNANGIVWHNPQKTTKPYALSMDVDYVNNAPAAANAGDKPVLVSTATINQLVLSAPDFSIKSHGEFSIASDDPLPSGSVEVVIDNVQAFLTSDLVPSQWRGVAGTALEKATGQTASAMTSVTIPAKREKKGVLYIGNVTFEELAASLLGALLQSQSPVGLTAPASPAPDASAPAAPADAAPDAAVPPSEDGSAPVAPVESAPDSAPAATTESPKGAM